MTLRASGRALLSTLCFLPAFGCSDPATPANGGIGGMTGTAGAVGGGVSGSPGTAGAPATGAAGTTGMVGTAGAGGGVIGGGMAGAGAGAGGASGVAGAGAGGASGVAGSAGSAGSAGATGQAGSGGSGGGGPVGMYPRGKSTGCGKAAPDGDTPDDYVIHNIEVSGVDPQFIADHPPNAMNGGYTFTMRNYFVQLPADYDANKPYAVTFGGGGCGNTNGKSGDGGGQQAGGINSIKIGLSYTYTGEACFADKYTNTPEVPYFDAVMADISAKYCVNLEKVFVGGWSSGAWEAITLGLARGGVIRGISSGAGGLRLDRPMPSGIPMAAILLTGAGDTTNPITGPTGSALARDEILKTNKCNGTATMPFALDGDCVQYTGCPAAFPVVWCTPPGGHIGGDNDHWAAVGAFWDGLPPAP